MEAAFKDEIYPWNQSLLDKLDDLRIRGVLPHAIALTSKEGWGGAHLLNVVCNLLLGFESNSETSTRASGNLLWIAPEGAVIKIDQIRSVIEFAYKTSRADSYKVIAIFEGHLLNVNAANALLKIVEEPPAGTIVVLETNRWANLPATLRSRLHRFSPDLSISQAKNWLAQAGIELSDQQFAEIGYAPLRAQNHESLGFSGYLDLTGERKVGEIVDQVLAQDTVGWLGNWYRFILGRIALKRDLLEEADLRRVFDFCDELIFSRKEIEYSNSANKRLLVERLIIMWRGLNIDALSKPV
jgi:DNA polymerase-3 subunit delta'